MYKQNSVERTFVKLYRFLSPRDKQTTETIQMKGFHACANFCAAYKDFALFNLLRLTSVKDLARHVTNTVSENEILDDEEVFMR